MNAFKGSDLMDSSLIENSHQGVSTNAAKDRLRKASIDSIDCLQDNNSEDNKPKAKLQHKSKK
tara:strand:+ start:236 stop:424 length:189 start_codon:yes stop_codon:yes gene_type:complete